MTAFYKLERTPDFNKDNRKKSYHVRYVNQTTSRMNKIVNMASSFSSFSSSDIIGVLEVLKQVIAMELADGHNVELKDFATFTVSLTAPVVYNKKKMNAAHVKFRTIKIRAAADFKNRVCRQMRIAKAPAIRKENYSPEKKRAILLHYLQTNKHITAKTYCQYTHVSKRTGTLDIRKYIEEGILKMHGYGPTTFYMLAD